MKSDPAVAYPFVFKPAAMHDGQFEGDAAAATTTAFAVIGTDCTIPTTPLTLKPLAAGWQMATALTWNATIAYTGHGRSDSVSFGGMSDVWSPILIDFQGNVQGGTISLNISAPIYDTVSGVHTTVPWSGTSSIVGAYPIPHDMVRARLGNTALCVIAYMETWPGRRFQQFLSDGTPYFGAPNGFGVMQLDPPGTPRQIWDWQENVDEGIARFQTAQNVVNNYVARTIAAHPTLAPPTSDQMICAAMTYYNGGGANGFHYIPNSTFGSWIRNPNPSGNQNFANALNYGDNGVSLMHQIPPPSDW